MTRQTFRNPNLFHNTPLGLLLTIVTDDTLQAIYEQVLAVLKECRASEDAAEVWQGLDLVGLQRRIEEQSLKRGAVYALEDGKITRIFK